MKIRLLISVRTGITALTLGFIGIVIMALLIVIVISPRSLNTKIKTNQTAELTLPLGKI